ncbi:hypothetical protein HID58_047914 [Brassica napus]|uniref:Uncharacterized protein n=1 Tax=Brassica napus TaxID=3708 RepID=A0ABQ8B0Q3_BRANA|nr:hypothetical protein HID58_047914 [Brassica napus]
MASSGVVIAHSAFDGLRLRRYAPFIVGRLIRFWDAKNIKKQGEFMGITLLFLMRRILRYMDSFLLGAPLITRMLHIVNPKIFGGNLYLNSTPATKFYFDPELDAIAEFTTSLEAPLGEAFPCIDTKEGVKKKEVVSIGELNKFISNSDEQVPSLDPSKYKIHRKLILFAKVGLLKSCNKMGGLSSPALAAAGSLTNFGLLYVATVVLIRTSLALSNSFKIVMRSFSYRVELLVEDGNDNCHFLVFDREMLKLTKQDAA